MRPIEALHKYWGYDSFRPLQSEVIHRVVENGGDTIALLPTGGGKSLTYQVPAVVLPGVTIVITPLIALMKDQIDGLKIRGIRAECVNSSMSNREIDVALDNCVYGDVKLLYIAPERIDTPIFRTRLMKMNVSLVAVDEAHCISQWGHDFRPSYLKINGLREFLGDDIPFLAVTATATLNVLNDIKKYLGMSDSSLQLFRMSFKRSNIRFVVRECQNKFEQIIRIIKGVAGSGIVYVRTRADAQQISDFLNQSGVSSNYYHAGLSHKIRSQRQNEWISGKIRVVVATNAFGMGIDKSDVRFVIHHQIPESVEAYYQEAGRAGRDGQESYAVILYNERDRQRASTRIDMEFPSLDVIKQVYDFICNHYQIGYGEGQGMVKDFDLREFCVRFKMFGLTVVNSLKLLELNGYLVLTDEMDNLTRVMFRVDRHELYRVQLNEEHLDLILKSLLRNYTGLFAQFVAIDEAYLAKITGYTEAMIVEKLLQLSRLRIINYIPRRRTPLIAIMQERVPSSDIRIAPETYGFRKIQMERRVDRMIDYVENVDGQCRSVLLCEYFNDMESEACGVCDMCISAKRSKRESRIAINPNFDESKTVNNINDDTIDERILRNLSEKSMTVHELLSMFNSDPSLVLDRIRYLMSQKIIKQNKNGLIFVC